jgi:hypothetical protein
MTVFIYIGVLGYCPREFRHAPSRVPYVLELCCAVMVATHAVPWEQESKGGLVAIRPSTAGWPPAARAGLDWATSHALEVAGGPLIPWSSTGVEQHFEIYATRILSSREAALAGDLGQSCRHFELRGAVRHYPGIACRNEYGESYFLHSRIRLAHPARILGSQETSGEK